MRNGKVKKSFLVLSAMLAATVFAEWTFDSRDRREDRNGAREERGTSDKRETKGIFAKWKELHAKDEKPAASDEKPLASPRKVETVYECDYIKIQIGTLPPEKSGKHTIGVVIGGAPYTYEALDKYIKEWAKLSTETPVILMCPLKSPHGNLMKVLDICYKHKMHKIAILSGVREDRESSGLSEDPRPDNFPNSSFQTPIKLELEHGRHGIVLTPNELPPSQLTIDVDRNGDCWVSNRKVAPEQIRWLVKDRYLKYLDFPCMIRADRNARHESVMKVISACLCGQHEARGTNREVSSEPKISLVALFEEHEEEDVYSRMDIYLPIPSESPRDPDDPAPAPWYCLTFAEEPPPPPEEEPPPPLEEVQLPPDAVPPPEDLDIQVDTPVVTADVQAPVSSEPPPFKPAPVDAALLVNSPVKLPGIKGVARDAGRIGVMTRGGAIYGDPTTEAAVMKALRWLKLHQDPDGFWPGVKPATTGFALLTYLAHGETPDSREFGATVERALNYLMGTVHEKNGKVVFAGSDGHEYAFLIATYALCEAYAMTKNPNVKAVAEKGLSRIIKGQSRTGGWDYNLNPLSTRDDLSFAGWALQALKAGKMAGLHVSGLEECIKKAIKCLQTRNFKNGGFNYVAGGNPTGLTATGCLAMQLLGQSNTTQVRQALEFMRDWKPTFDPKDLPKGKDPKIAGPCPQYYCYYATQCKYQAGMAPNAAAVNLASWKKWNAEMKALYPKTIINDKYKDGSPITIKDARGKERPVGHWVNKDAHTARPVMDTCLAALQLMVYYRYLPTTSTRAAQIDEAAEALKQVEKAKKDDITITFDLDSQEETDSSY